MADEERTEEGWEARMAARARERRLATEKAEGARLADLHVRDLLHTQSWMTLDYAVDYLFRERGLAACACIGPPDCCRDRFDIASRLHNAALIAVKMMQEVADR